MQNQHAPAPPPLSAMTLINSQSAPATIAHAVLIFKSCMIRLSLQNKSPHFFFTFWLTANLDNMSILSDISGNLDLSFYLVMTRTLTRSKPQLTLSWWKSQSFWSSCPEFMDFFSPLNNFHRQWTDRRTDTLTCLTGFPDTISSAGNVLIKPRIEPQTESLTRDGALYLSLSTNMASAHETVLLKSTLEIQNKPYSVKLTPTELYWETITSARAASGPYSEPLVSEYLASSCFNHVDKIL